MLSKQTIASGIPYKGPSLCILTLSSNILFYAVTVLIKGKANSL